MRVQSAPEAGPTTRALGSSDGERIDPDWPGPRSPLPRAEPHEHMTLVDDAEAFGPVRAATWVLHNDRRMDRFRRAHASFRDAVAAGPVGVAAVMRRGCAMFSIACRGREWIVMQSDELVSVHPTREEAERAIEWLARNHTFASDALSPIEAGRTSPGREALRHVAQRIRT